MGSGFYARDNSIHHNFQRCLVIHNSHGLDIENNVAFDTIGHCYFLEDGAERANSFINNLAILSRVGSLIPSDSEPANFWITVSIQIHKKTLIFCRTQSNFFPELFS